MRHLGIMLGAFLLLGCAGRGPFDTSKFGSISCTHEMWSDGSTIHFAWDIPGDEVREILSYLEPRSDKYGGMIFVSSSRTATMQTKQGPREIRWSRVKKAKRVLLFSIEGIDSRYMLVEPHATAFYAMLNRHETKVPHPPAAVEEAGKAGR